MKKQFPFTIQNATGETIMLHGIKNEAGGEKLYAENYVEPKAGSPMHVHKLQDECFIVVKGTIGYQIAGEEEQFATCGETVLFKRGVPHKFWNAGDDILHCSAWVQPANTFAYFIDKVFDAQNKAGSKQPQLFDAVYLLTKYGAEYDILDIPWPVKKFIFPIVYVTGKLMNRYKHFDDAPAAVKA